MALEALVERLVSASGLLLAVIGIAAALLSANLVKRLVGLLFALMGAVLAGLAFAAPSTALTAGVAVALAYLFVGASLLVRLQEAHGRLDVAEIDAADAAMDRPGAGP